MLKDLEANLPPFEPIGTPVDLSQVNASKKQSGATCLELLVISSPRLAITMAWAAQWAAIGPYLSTMLSSSAVQAIQFIGPLCGILVAPTIGALSDRSTSSYGRRRPFLFWAAIGSVICYILMGYTREMGEALGDYGDGSDGTPTHRPWTAILTVVFYLWMDVTVNVVQTPILLLISDFSGDRQTLGSALGQGWSTLGGIMVAGYIEFWGAAYLSLHWFLGMLALMMVVTVGACCFVANEISLTKDCNDTTTAFTRVKQAFASIYYGLITLPYTLVVYAVCLFCVCYGYTAYSGNKGQFFGLEVYGGSSEGADACGNSCSEAQSDYNRGVQIAGGRTDLICSIVGYVFTWLLPLLVKKFGGQLVITVSLIPQVLLIALAFTKVVDVAVVLVVLVSFTQTTFFAMLVPIIFHVTGKGVDIGVYVGAINSANCLGQLLNYIIGTAIVNTSMGYTLPVLVGGTVSAVGFLVAITLFRVDLKSM